MLALCSTATFASDDSSSGTTSLKVGGFALVNMGSYLDGTTTTGDDFPPSSIPTSSLSAYDESRYILDVSTTRLYMDLTHTSQSLGDVKFYVEGDFRGTGYAFRLRQANIQLKNFTIGQTWSIFTDLAANAPTVDIQGVNSRTFFRSPQVSYHNTIKGNLSFAASIERPSVSITSTSGYLKDVIESVPDFLAYIQTKGSAGHLRIGGVWRTMKYSDYENEAVETNNGWGVQASGTLNASKGLTFYGQGIYGKGIGMYINDLASQSMDMVESYDNDGDVAALGMYGLSLGTKVRLTEKMDFCASYSQVNIDETEGFTSSSMYKQGRYIEGTVLYYPSKNITLGAEYLYGSREDFDGAKGTAQRVNIMIKYTFSLLSTILNYK